MGYYKYVSNTNEALEKNIILSNKEYIKSISFGNSYDVIKTKPSMDSEEIQVWYKDENGVIQEIIPIIVKRNDLTQGLYDADVTYEAECDEREDTIHIYHQERKIWVLNDQKVN